MNITEVYRQLRKPFRSTIDGRVYHATAKFCHLWADIIVRQTSPEKRGELLRTICDMRDRFGGYIHTHYTYSPACLLDPLYISRSERKYWESL